MNYKEMDWLNIHIFIFTFENKWYKDIINKNANLSKHLCILSIVIKSKCTNRTLALNRIIYTVCPGGIYQFSCMVTTFKWTRFLGLTVVNQVLSSK